MSFIKWIFRKPIEASAFGLRPAIDIELSERELVAVSTRTALGYWTAKAALRSAETERQLQPVAHVRAAGHSAYVSMLICIAAALIDDGQGRVLLVRKRDTSTYMHSGGKLEPGELPVEALRRELSEELDFVPKLAQPEFLGTFHCQAANEPDHMLEAHLFHVRATEGDFRISAELNDAVWVPIESAGQLALAPLTRDHVLPLARAISSR